MGMKRCGRCHQEMVEHMVVCPVCGNFMTDTMKSKGYTYSSVARKEQPKGQSMKKASVSSEKKVWKEDRLVEKSREFMKKLEELQKKISETEREKERAEQKKQLTVKQIRQAEMNIAVNEKRIAKLGRKFFGRKKAQAEIIELQEKNKILAEKMKKLRMEEEKNRLDSICRMQTIEQMKAEYAELKKQYIDIVNE